MRCFNKSFLAFNLLQKYLKNDISFIFLFKIKPPNLLALEVIRPATTNCLVTFFKYESETSSFLLSS